MRITMRKPVLLFFQQILPGDVRKQRAKSNDATTGGGARDLRIRPAQLFAPLLLPMFPHPTGQAGVTQNDVFWVNAQGGVESATIELWRPTEARPDETRLARITAIESWIVNQDEYAKARAAGKVWFFLLVMDADSRVWARTYEERHWRDPKASAEVRDYFLKRIKATPKGQSVRGFMNFITGETYE